MATNARTEKSTATPDGSGLCGAKTKDGSPCRKLPCSGRTRCRLHGGASPLGIGHPRFVHGAYSRYYAFSLPEKWLRQREKEQRHTARVVERFQRAYEAECERIHALQEAQKQEVAMGTRRKRGRPRKFVEPDYWTFYQQWKLKQQHLKQRRKKRVSTVEAAKR